MMEGTPRWLHLLLLLLLHACLLAGLAGVAVLLQDAVLSKQAEVQSKQQDLVRLQQDVASLQGKNRSLRYDIQFLKTDDGIEKIAREKLDLVKPGEVTFRVIEPPRPRILGPANRL